MARIRTIKPEAFTSESLAEVTVEAERTFFGLLTQADDHGRHRDNAAVIAGLLWPLRAEHTSVHVEDDLQQLANAGLICRYTGCDGRRYLHVVTWHQHQKIDRPSQSRLPACPQHHAADRCGSCKGVCAKGTEVLPSSARGFADASTNPPGALDRTAPPSSGPAAPRDAASLPHQPALADPDAASGPTQGDVAGQTAFADSYPTPPRGLAEASGTGSRILDPGSSFPTGREAPAAQASASQLLGEYISACDKRPPSDVIGHLGRITKRLLAEGIDPQDIRAGLSRFAANPKHPSVLTSMVNEAMNSRSAGLAGPGSGPNVPAHRAWTNPVDVAAAYAEEL